MLETDEIHASRIDHKHEQQKKLCRNFFLVFDVIFVHVEVDGEERARSDVATGASEIFILGHFSRY